MDPNTTRLIGERNQARAMLEQTLADRDAIAGRLQTCEEIIARTRAIVAELQAGAHLTGYAHENLVAALGPA